MYVQEGRSASERGHLRGREAYEAASLDRFAATPLVIRNISLD
jgi:hypothetical protein